MVITDLEHLESVAKETPKIEGGLIDLKAFAAAYAKASKQVTTWTIAYTVSIAL
ncbi:hypothetical protein PCC8801_3272 [Rippkaea orientalis PCC 8801]|uniref:Uncharacterized protein n=1 Tax=Rippkaea orientalis (strain PCC 8801 / RF-1) TaxID=41431 RepID=B7JYE3_RIPO1|nr:hypothetical protein [Rippkaea orientalis]ACK67245.1 hypothetical protein PCC8801_3272 [Rippkaea orientalis PCC 8801]